MKIYTKYFIINSIKIYLVAVFVICLTLWMLQIFKFTYLLSNGVSVISYVNISLLALPSLLYTTLPVTYSVVLAYVYYHMKQSNELLVMSNNQVSNYYIASPGIILSFLICMISCFLSLYLIPSSNAAWKQKLQQSQNITLQQIIKPRTFTKIGNDIYIYVEKVDHGLSLRDVIIIDDSKSIPSVVLAQEASIIYNSKISESYVLVRNGYRQSEVANKRYSLKFEEAKIPLNILYNKTSIYKDSIKDYTVNQILAEYLNSKIKFIEAILEISARIIWPLYTIVFSMFISIMFLKQKYSRRSSAKQTIKMFGCAVGCYAFYFIEEMYITKFSIFPIVFGLQFIVLSILYKKFVEYREI